MFRLKMLERVLGQARAITRLGPTRPPVAKNINKQVAAQIKSPLNYRFPTNNLYNPMTEYVDVKENTLCNNQGAHKRKKRLGRGRGSGKGKSCGHGQKGQGHRRNKMFWGFEGGQTPLKKRLPKLGMSKKNQRRLDYVNIEKILYFMQRNWLSCSPDKYITIKDLKDSGLLRRVKWGVKLLSRGAHRLQQLKKPLFIEVTDCSKQVVEIIKANGGNVRIIYLTKLKLKEHLQPGRYLFPLAEPLPPQWKVLQLEKYRDYGAEVVYNMPRWVKEELEKGGEHFHPTKKQPLRELVEATKVRVKKSLSRQYKFDL